MFSFHELHSLYAEASLVGLAIAVLIYRCFGSNEWIKTHGVILVSYYAIGGIAFDELEGWPLLDTVYFLTVTITTVGYGDICPETDAGKIFTVLYALIGIIFVFAALSPLVDALMFFKVRSISLPHFTTVSPCTYPSSPDTISPPSRT